VPPASTAVALPEWVDAEDAAAALATGGADMFWLDAGIDAAMGWSWVGRGVVEPDPERVRAVDCARPSGAPHEAGRFLGGWVGWLDYDGGAVRAGAPRHSVAGAVETWLRVDELLAFDHARRTVWAISSSGDPAHLASLASRARPASFIPPAPVRTSSSVHRPDEYADLIERCRAHIRDGDAYQLCLTTRFRVDGDVDAWSAYRRLRRDAPSHHGGYLRIGGHALLSASPERFLELADGTVRTHPIKGTRPRSADPERDRALAEELRADPKERAENVMIVDLMRNDLSRVCAPGGVAVERLLDVETYPPVHQLVSTVAGNLRAGTSLGQVLDAAFPAGSMTGAPKLSAMAILAALEGVPRGLYAGCFGWVADGGSADLAMTIRSILVDPGGATVGAGGGITWRSRAAAEVAEVALKARAPLAALGAALPPGW
jgi:anthranilate synthase component 1